MEQLNKIDLRGNVGSIRLQKVGDNKVARINLATNYAYKDRNGAAVIETTWHNVVAWADKAPDIELVDKGSKLAVTGRVRTQKYIGADELEHTSYEVVATSLKLINTSEALSCEF